MQHHSHLIKKAGTIFVSQTSPAGSTELRPEPNIVSMVTRRYSEKSECPTYDLQIASTSSDGTGTIQA